MASRKAGHSTLILAAMALVLAPSGGRAQETPSTPVGPVAPLAEAFVTGPPTQQAVDPFLIFAIAPFIARNFELNGLRIGLGIEVVTQALFINQMLSLSANLGRLSTEFRNYWTAAFMAGVLFYPGPMLRTLHPRVRFGLVADRSSFKMGSTDPRTEIGFALSAGFMYGLTQALVGGADLSLERVAGLNQMILSVSLMLGPLGSLTVGS